MKSADPSFTFVPSLQGRSTPERDGARKAISRHITIYEAATAVAIMSAMVLWCWRSTHQVHVADVVVSAAIVLASVICGRVVACAIGLRSLFERAPTLPFLLGAYVLSAAICGLRFVTPFSAPLLLAGLLLVVLALYASLSRQVTSWTSRQHSQRIGAFVTMSLLVATTHWQQHCLPIIERQQDGLMFRPSREYFCHATYMLALHGDQPAFRSGSFNFAGSPLVFYHYGGFAFPLCFYDAGGRTALETLSAIWAPLSMLLAGLGVYTLASAWFGTRIGLICTTIVIVLPDPTYYQSDIPLFSFQRLIEVSPSTAYGLGLAGLATAIVARALRRDRWRLVLVGVAAAFGVIFFKANLLASMLPWLGAWIACEALNRFGKRAVIGLAIASAAAAIVLALATRLPAAPTLRLDAACGEDYLDFCRTFLPRDAWAERLWSACHSSWMPGRALARIAFILTISWQGQLLVVAATAVIPLLWLPRLRWATLLLLVALGIYVALALAVAPNTNGDPFELQHRGFAWTHAVTLCLSAGALLSIYPIRRWIFYSALPLSASALVLPFWLGLYNYFPFGAIRLPAGLCESMDYIRTNIETRAVVADATGDPVNIVAACSERRAFTNFGRNDVGSNTFPGRGVLRQVRAERVREVDALLACSDLQRIKEWTRRNRVDAVLVHPSTTLCWPRELRSAPDFARDGFRVYRLPR